MGEKPIDLPLSPVFEIEAFGKSEFVIDNVRARVTGVYAGQRINVFSADGNLAFAGEVESVDIPDDDPFTTVLTLKPS